MLVEELQFPIKADAPLVSAFDSWASSALVKAEETPHTSNGINCM